MAIVRPFCAVRPSEAYKDVIPALPYDVYTREEARREVEAHPLSFLSIDRPETLMAEDADMYGEEAYRTARERYESYLAEGKFVTEEKPVYFLYELTMDGRTESGIVGCSSADDYLNGVILKHENTRADKELDRIRHVDALSAQTGPIFLVYRNSDELKRFMDEVRTREPLYDFCAEDSVRHRVFRIDRDEEIAFVRKAFDAVDHTYIADGHHRAASAVRVCEMRRQAHPDYTGNEEFNYFLSVLFPADELQIFDYNRMVSDLNGRTEEAFLREVGENFNIREEGSDPVRPAKKGEFGMYLGGTWYRLTEKEPAELSDEVGSLDVSILQDKLLKPVLGIDDPKTDRRIRFLGGIRGLKPLEETQGVSFSMYPTSIEELFRVADGGKLMPPKSTWFEPKLRSGFFVHPIER